MLSRSERFKRARITLARGGQIDGHLIAPLIGIHSPGVRSPLEAFAEPSTAHRLRSTSLANSIRLDNDHEPAPRR